MSVRDKDVIEESINFHADTNVTSEGGKNAGGQANIPSQHFVWWTL